MDETANGNGYSANGNGHLVVGDEKHESVKKKILVIGDQLPTDIQGAKNIGVDSLMVVNTGVHYETDLQ